MLNGAKLRTLYSKIQTQLFNMIPEKWNRIYLYAAVFENKKGEMFFYYYPTGLLKKNPVNVYEVPTKFNVDEDAYMKLVNNLYETIMLIRKEFEVAKEKPWTNLTISIENFKFKIEYDYENLSELSSEERHIIWQYKYLSLSPERLPKKERLMLQKYIENEKNDSKKIKEHTESLYKKKAHNNIEYNKEERDERTETDEEIRARKLDKYEMYKKQQELKKQKLKDENEIIEEIKNQILKI